MTAAPFDPTLFSQPDEPRPDEPQHQEAQHHDVQYRDEQYQEPPPDFSELRERAVAGLNPEQFQAVTHRSGPLLVVAGPGSGKTRVLTHRIAALVADGAPTWSILAVTFTNKAAGEMKERLQKLLAGFVDEQYVSSMWVCTFHSACVRILRQNAHLVGRSRNFGIADSTDARKILSRILEPHGLSAQARDLQSQISLAKNRMLDPQNLHGQGMHPNLAEFWAEYQKSLAQQDLLDFDDLLVFTLRLLVRHPEVAERYRERFSHVLIDEFQDTNQAQYQIIRALTGDAHDVCAVGDQDQSVYAFRGATSAVLEAYESDWPHTTVVTLDQNYRSTGSILALAQGLIDQNPAKHRAHLRTDNEPGPLPEYVTAPTDLDEADFVASSIRSSSLPASAHAVIYRTNAQSRVLEAALRDRGVPYRIIGGVSFYDHAEVRDAMAWLRLCANPRDREALRRAASVPKRGLGPTTLDLAFDLADRFSVSPLDVLDACSEEIPKRARTALEGFAEALLDVLDAAESGAAAAVDAVLSMPGFVETAVTREGRDDQESRRENLRELATAARQFEAGDSSVNIQELAEMTGPERLEAFLQNAALMSSADQDDTTACVELMTAHAAKGREFDSVYVTGVEYGLFPHTSASDDAGIQEELRLLFVAATRARKRLSLTWCASRFRFNERTDQLPSPFMAPCIGLVNERELTSTRRPSSFGGGYNKGGYNKGGGGGYNKGGYNSGSYSGARKPIASDAWRTGISPSGSSRPKMPASLNQVQGVKAQGPRLSASQLQVGVAVRHELYGQGVVESFNDTSVHVRFQSGTRVLMLELAPLTLA